MRKLLLIAGGAELIYLALALLMGVIPGYLLSQIPPGHGVRPLTALQAEGRQVYVANGCSYCHTQQVRPLPEDHVFGRPSAAGDFAYQTPELLGSERTGPDLTDVAERRGSDVWQYIHLYEPRAVVPHSIMPSFAWMFDVVDKAPDGVAPVPLPKKYAPGKGIVIPTHDATALVAYLLSLKQAPLAGDSPATAMAVPQRVLSGSTSKMGDTGAGEKSIAAEVNIDRGKQLYDANCAACHQVSGDGLPGAFPPLKGNMVVNASDPGVHIHVVLFGLQNKVVDGIKYPSPMPPWRSQFNDEQIAEIISYERGAWGNHGNPVTVKEVAAVRAKGS